MRHPSEKHTKIYLAYSALGDIPHPQAFLRLIPLALPPSLSLSLSTRPLRRRISRRACLSYPRHFSLATDSQGESHVGAGAGKIIVSRITRALELSHRCKRDALIRHLDTSLAREREYNIGAPRSRRRRA